MSGHTSFLTSLLQLPDGRLVTGSGDKDIRVWSLGDWSCVSVLSDHTGAVRCLVHLDDGSLASGSDDFTVKIWSVCSQPDSPSFVMLIWNVYRARSSGSFSVERTLSGHTGFVMALMQLHNGSGSIVSGARDGLIKIWSRSGKRPIEHIRYNSAVSDWMTAMHSGPCLQTLSGHEGTVRCLSQFTVNGKLKIVSGGVDMIVRVWDTSQSSAYLSVCRLVCREFSSYSLLNEKKATRKNTS